MSGNPDYDKYAHEQFNRQTKHGPGTYQRRIHPGLQDLTEGEMTALRVVNSNYDRFRNQSGHADLYLSRYPRSRQAEIKKLEGLGFLRIEQDGRIVPSFVFEEHKSKGKIPSDLQRLLDKVNR